MDFPKRKSNRLKTYDYRDSGHYFITICTKNKEKLFWENGAEIQLSETGKIAEQSILEISQHYHGVIVDKYVVMPNHVHLILQMVESDQPHPPVSTIIGQMKRTVSKCVRGEIWQKSFHDHVIRDEQDYLKIWNYIECNPIKWNDDCFYVE